MSGNPTYEVLRSYREYLATLMPLQPGLDVPVSVWYSHPGDRVEGNSLVWFDDIDEVIEIDSMRAGTLKRHATVTFSILIACELAGATAGEEGVALQYECDSFVQTVRNLIDYDIATEKHLQVPELIDEAKVVSSSTERGTTATGCGTRTTMRVSFEARYTD